MLCFFVDRQIGSSKKCVITASNEKSWSFYTDPGKNLFWIHDEVGVIFCYFNICFVKTVHYATQHGA